MANVLYGHKNTHKLSFKKYHSAFYEKMGVSKIITCNMNTNRVYLFTKSDLKKIYSLNKCDLKLKIIKIILK